MADRTTGPGQAVEPLTDDELAELTENADTYTMVHSPKVRRVCAELRTFRAAEEARRRGAESMEERARRWLLLQTTIPLREAKPVIASLASDTQETAKFVAAAIRRKASEGLGCSACSVAVPGL